MQGHRLEELCASNSKEPSHTGTYLACSSPSLSPDVQPPMKDKEANIFLHHSSRRDRRLPFPHIFGCYSYVLPRPTGWSGVIYHKKSEMNIKYGASLNKSEVQPKKQSKSSQTSLGLTKVVSALLSGRRQVSIFRILPKYFQKDWKSRLHLERVLFFTNFQSGTPACRQVTLENCLSN